MNPNYHVPNQPFFDALELKGGGDALGAARSVLQTAEFDYAWNLAVEDEILKRLEASGKGKLIFLEGSDIEFISLNVTDPWNEVDGERASAKSKHPAFSDKAVRQAMGMLVDRKGILDFIYGRGGVATANFLNNPPRVRSPNMKYEFNVDKANQVLEAAGWKKGADGIRAKGNVKLKFVYQTSVSQPRQKTPGDHQGRLHQGRHRAGTEERRWRRCSLAATRRTRTRIRSSGPTSRCSRPR